MHLLGHYRRSDANARRNLKLKADKQEAIPGDVNVPKRGPSRPRKKAATPVTTAPITAPPITPDTAAPVASVTAATVAPDTTTKTGRVVKK